MMGRMCLAFLKMYITAFLYLHYGIYTSLNSFVYCEQALLLKSEQAL